MSFLSSLNICGSGMTAQRLRLDVAAENIANIETTRTESGEPYRRKTVVLQAEEVSFASIYQKTLRGADDSTGGVRAVEIADEESEPKLVYDPDHPDANAEGYVEMPNIDLVKEITDSMSATRSYEANITAYNAVKVMAERALEIGK